MRRLILALAFAATAQVAAAATLAWSGLAVFGDSLSDPGNLFAATGQPPAPYFEGRFSNGPVWAERVADGFAVSGNFAFGGARAATDADGVPDFAAQVAAFAGSGLRAALGDRPLAAVWLGANDLFAGISSLAAGPAIEGATAALRAGYAALRGEGFDDFLLFNVPDLGRTPLYDLILPPLSPLATGATRAFNAELAGLAGELAATGAAVTLIDVDALFSDLLADPARFGLSETGLPCLFVSGSPFVGIVAAGVASDRRQPPVCDAATADRRAFYDLVHPNRIVHAAIADAVDATLAPVPLPAAAWLLFGGLGGLVAVGRRRRASA